MVSDRAVHRARITVNLPGTERFGPVRLRNHSTHHELENYRNYRTEPLKYNRHAGVRRKFDKTLKLWIIEPETVSWHKNREYNAFPL